MWPTLRLAESLLAQVETAFKGGVVLPSHRRSSTSSKTTESSRPVPLPRSERTKAFFFGRRWSIRMGHRASKDKVIVEDSERSVPPSGKPAQLSAPVDVTGYCHASWLTPTPSSTDGYESSIVDSASDSVLSTTILEPLELDLLSFGPPPPPKPKASIVRSQGLGLGVAQPWQSEITESRIARVIRLHQEEAEHQRVLEEEWSKRVWFTDVPSESCALSRKGARRAATI